MSPKPLDQIDRDWGKGNCYYTTLQIMKDCDELIDKIDDINSVELVHGLITVNKQEIEHAWIEINSAIVWETSVGLDERPSIQKYYQDMNANPLRKFTQNEVDALISCTLSASGSPQIVFWGRLKEQFISDKVKQLQKNTSLSLFNSDIIFSDLNDPNNKEMVKRVNDMKTDLSFLPEIKQQELSAITTLLREMCDDIEMVILYGSYARNEYKETKDLEPDRWSGHVSDYDILVVTGRQETAQNRKLKSQIETACRDKELSATPRLTLFDLQELNIKLIEGQYFYSDVRKEGIVLFNPKAHILAEERKLTNAEKARVARDHYEEWYKLAQTSFRHYGYALKDNDIKWSSFCLQQATEACYKCILLVFENYSPQEHYLTILRSFSAKHIPKLKEHFPEETGEQHRRFTLLDNAYIGARYIRDFFVEKEDIEYLAPLVEKLLTITKEECEKKIQKLARDDKS